MAINLSLLGNRPTPCTGLMPTNRPRRMPHMGNRGGRGLQVNSLPSFHLAACHKHALDSALLLPVAFLLPALSTAHASLPQRPHNLSNFPRWVCSGPGRVDGYGVNGCGQSL
jgi:hypothetical protein